MTSVPRGSRIAAELGRREIVGTGSAPARAIRLFHSLKLSCGLSTPGAGAAAVRPVAAECAARVPAAGLGGSGSCCGRNAISIESA
jgi:hypothetical protein